MRENTDQNNSEYGHFLRIVNFHFLRNNVKISLSDTETALQRCSYQKCDFNFIEITVRYGCSPVNFLHIFQNILF